MSMLKTCGDAADAPRSVFISYRRLDDMPPPEQPKAKGFVGYLFEQLKFELMTLGLPEEVLWLDRGKIEVADKFTQVIADQLARSDILLAILSRNYVQSGWCREEVEAFAERLQTLDVQTRRRRIFRIDKHDVPDSDLPPAVRDLQAVKFYEKNEKGIEQEYYWRGKVRSRKLYLVAIRELGESIFRRLQELGVGRLTVTERPQLKALANGRTVYAAKPGSDLRDAYETLVRELRGRGYHVAPDPETELPAYGESATQGIRTALSQAEASIHLIGERPGFQPEGSSVGIVSLQLGEAGREASNRSGFERLIWAPKVVPGSVEDAARVRDPLDVLQTFDAHLDSDQIDGDTAARFNEFVLQRLEGRGAPAPAPRKRYVYVGSAPVDEKLISYVARQIQELGASPIFVADGARADHALICWGDTDEISILEALESPAIESWRAAKPEGRLVLLACPPHSQTKMRVCGLGKFGPADLVIDGTIEQIRSTLEPILVR